MSRLRGVLPDDPIAYRAACGMPISASQGPGKRPRPTSSRVKMYPRTAVSQQTLTPLPSGSRSIDAKRDAVIGDVVDWNLLLFDAVIEFLSGWEASIKLIVMWFMRSIDIR
jgi:hypothetical protein